MRVWRLSCALFSLSTHVSPFYVVICFLCVTNNVHTFDPWRISPYCAYRIHPSAPFAARLPFYFPLDKKQNYVNIGQKCRLLFFLFFCFFWRNRKIPTEWLINTNKNRFKLCLPIEDCTSAGRGVCSAESACIACAW